MRSFVGFLLLGVGEANAFYGFLPARTLKTFDLSATTILASPAASPLAVDKLRSNPENQAESIKPKKMLPSLSTALRFR